MDKNNSENQNQTKGNMMWGVTQANGLENEIVKIIEARIILDSEERKSER